MKLSIVQLKGFIFLLTGIFLTLNSYSQRVGINTTGALPNASALLDVDAAPANDKGMLIPRVSLTNVNVYAPISGAPVTSLLVYNTNAAMTGGALGYWYWDGAKWVQLGTASSGNAWLLLGNAGTIDGTHFLGTTDPVPLNFKVNGQKAGRIDHLLFSTFFGYQAGNANTTGWKNTAIGLEALLSNTTGYSNTAIGADALRDNTSGYYNTAIGIQALQSNTSGNENTATGVNALLYNTTGNYNAANGRSALVNNISGNNNTATGYEALSSNTSGYSNVAMGIHALNNNTDRSNLVAIGDSALYNNGVGAAASIEATANTAVGSKALYNNNTGYQNTANGNRVLFSNTSGNNNTGTGFYTLYSNNTGYQNTAFGVASLFTNTTGYENTAVGQSALYTNNGNRNTAVGRNALSNLPTGEYNTALGYNALLGGGSLDNSTALGANSIVIISNKVRIGDVNVTTVETQLNYSTVSDGRFKNNITQEVEGLDFISRLRPVVYNFDTKKFDEFLMKNVPDSIREKRLHETNYNESSSIRQSGFIAQEVEQAAKESGYNFNGVHKPTNESDNYSIAYSLFTVPLVKAVQELNAKNKSLEIANQSLQAEIEKLQTTNLDYENRFKKLENILGTNAGK